MKTPKPDQEEKSWGTRVVEKYRPQMNKLTRAERECLLNQAMRIAYGKNWRAITKRNNEKFLAELNRFTKEERRQAQEEFKKWWFGKH